MPQHSIEQKQQAEGQQKALLTVLENIQHSLRTSALFHLADDLYTKEERKQLRDEYLRLLEAHRQAQENLRETSPGDGLSWEARIAQHGEERARAIMAPTHAAFEASREAYAMVGAFEKEHKILLRLWECLNELSRSKWE